MGVNRFESPLSTRPISRYIATPFAEIHQALRTRQDEYDKMIAQQDQTKQNALGLKSISEHDDYRDAYINKVNGAFEQLHAKNIDPSRREYQKEQGDIIRQLASDSNLQVLQRSILNKKEYEDNKEKLKAEGKYATYNDYYQHKPFQGIKEDGTPNEFQRMPIYSAEDHIKPVEEHFKALKADGRTFSGIKGYDLERGIITSGGYTTKAITEDRVRKVAQKYTPEFLASQAGRDFQRMAVANGAKTPEEVYKMAYQHVENLGMTNVFSDGGTHNDMKVDWSTLKDSKTPTDVYAPNANGAAFTNPNAFIPDKPGFIDKVKDFLKGSVGMDNTPEVVKNMVEGGYTVAETSGMDKDGQRLRKYYKDGKMISSTEYDKVEKGVRDQLATKKTRDIISSSFDRLKTTEVPTSLDVRGVGRSKEEYEANQIKALKDIQNVTLSGKQVGEDQAKLYGDLLERAGGSQLYNVQGASKPMTLSEIADEEKVEVKDIKIHPNLIHYENLDRDRPGGGLEVSIQVGKRSIPAFTPLNDNFTSSTGLISQIGQNSIYQGHDTYTEKKPLKVPHGDGSTTNIHTWTVPKKDYSPGKEVPFETIVIVEDVDKNGKVTDKEELPYSVFKEKMSRRADNQLKKTFGSGKSINTSDAKSYHVNP